MLLFACERSRSMSTVPSVISRSIRPSSSMSCGSIPRKLEIRYAEALEQRLLQEQRALVIGGRGRVLVADVEAGTSGFGGFVLDMGRRRKARETRCNDEEYVSP
jgi:hypothetical protein